MLGNRIVPAGMIRMAARSRRAASHTPRAAPVALDRLARIVRAAGIKRQFAPSSGRSAYWYARSRPSSSVFIAAFAAASASSSRAASAPSAAMPAGGQLASKAQHDIESIERRAAQAHRFAQHAFEPVAVDRELQLLLADHVILLWPISRRPAPASSCRCSASMRRPWRNSLANAAAPRNRCR